MYSCFSVVMELFGLDFVGALRKIRADEKKILSSEMRVIQRQDMVFDVIADGYHPYFERYGISGKTLEKYNVKLARTIFKNGTLYMRSTASNPVFVYNFPSKRIKIYRPLSPEKAKKWGGNSTASDVSGITQLPKKGVLCFITSSLKDVMTLDALGFPAIAFNGEGYGIKGESHKIVSGVLKIVKSRYRYVMLYLDSDDPGLQFSMQFATKHNIPFIVNPTASFKDISDYRAKYGEHKAFKLIKKLVRNKLKMNVEVPF